MRHQLYWNTVSPLLTTALRLLMNSAVFDQFRLVGGTSLSLQLGHRESIDIDLFTDAEYGSVDFEKIDAYLRHSFSYVSPKLPGIIGMGTSYFAGNDERDAIKIDLYYTEYFIQPAIITEGIRLATIEEIIAMKIDIVQRGGRKKDFWDLHEMMDMYRPEQMITLHKARYPYNHDENLIRSNLSNFISADDDFEPVCLKGKHWELIKMDIIKSLSK